MASERLSRLQKWILKALYIIGPEYRIRVKELKSASVMGLKKIFDKPNIEGPFSIPAKVFESEFPHCAREAEEHYDIVQPFFNSVDSTFSRSIRNLHQKEFIRCFSHTSSDVFDDIFSEQAKRAAKQGYGEVLWHEWDFDKKIMEIALSPEGEAKAKELLNVKVSELNDKKNPLPQKMR